MIRVASAALLLGALLGPAWSTAAVAAPEASSPAVVEAWLLLGEHERALREAQQLASAPDADWRDHAAYIRAASASHLRWAVVDEYRWLAAQEPMRPEMVLLAAWAKLLQATGAELGPALAALEDAAPGQGPAGLQLLARGLLHAGEDERAAELLLGTRAPAATRLRVEALVGAGAYREAATLALASIDQHPRHPEVAEPLWDRGVPKRRVRKARQAAVHAAQELLDEHDPELLLGAWWVLASAKESQDAARAADGVSAAVPGLELPSRLPYGQLMLQHLGEGLARTGQDSVDAQLTSYEQAQVATVRARTLRDDGLVDQARRAYRDAIALDGSDPELLLEAAALHLDVEPQRSLAWVGQALLLLACEPGMDAAQRRLVIARGLELQASSLHALDRHDQALSFQLVASLLQPTPKDLEQLAALQEQQGGREAALESLALAAALGSQDARPEMERLYHGPASVDALVTAVSADLAVWTGAGVQPLPAAAPERPLAGRTLSTTAGDLSFDALEGQLVVLVFWASWCAPCADELPMVDGLLDSWTADGLPVTVVAVSVDQSEADYRRGLGRFRELGLTFALDPSVSRAMGIEAVPATRIIDAQGQVAGQLQGFHEGHDQRLDALVRGLLEP